MRYEIPRKAQNTLISHFSEQHDNMVKRALLIGCNYPGKLFKLIVSSLPKDVKSTARPGRTCTAQSAHAQSHKPALDPFPHMVRGPT